MRVVATLLLAGLIGNPQGNVRHAGLRQLRHGNRPVSAVSFIKHGTRLVSAGMDGSVAMWNPQTRKLLWKIDLDASSRTKQSYTISTILDLAVSPDERFIAVSYNRGLVIGNTLQSKDDDRILLLDATDGHQMHSIGQHAGLIGESAFSPNGKYLVSISGDKTARLWDAQTGRMIWSVDLGGRGHAVAFSRDGRFVAIGAISEGPWVPVVEIRDTETGRVERELKQAKQNVADLAFSKDGNLVAVLSNDVEGSQVELWDTATFSLTRSLSEPGHYDDCLTLSADGRFVFTGGFVDEEGIITVHDLRNGTQSSRRLPEEVTSIAVADDGMIAAGTWKGKIFLVHQRELLQRNVSRTRRSARIAAGVIVNDQA
jgi:WD40 repeat protein